MMCDNSSEPSQRETIRELLADNIRALDERAKAAREEDLDDEPLQLRRLRTLSHLARQYRLLARDADVDKLEADVDALESMFEEGEV